MMRVLVTAGPTREYLDPVRFLSNPSTGTLGFLVAAAAKAGGHSVTVIAGPVTARPPERVRVVGVTSAREMRDAVFALLPESDVLVMSAAVTDWRPAVRSAGKLKGKEPWSLRLVPNPDILKESLPLRRRLGTVTIGFALESSALLRNGAKKLREKGLDLIVVNGPENFGEAPAKGRIHLIRAGGARRDCSGFSKPRLASRIVVELERLAGER